MKDDKPVLELLFYNFGKQSSWMSVINGSPARNSAGCLDSTKSVNFQFQMLGRVIGQDAGIPLWSRTHGMPTVSMCTDTNKSIILGMGRIGDGCFTDVKYCNNAISSSQQGCKVFAWLTSYAI